MNVNLKNLAIAGLFALPAILVGCRSGYDVDVRNLTDQPIHARLVTPHQDGANVKLRETRLGPGDRGSLFVQRDARERVALEVDFAGNIGYPATLDLVRGKTVVNVRRADTGAQGRLILEEVPRP